MSAPTVNPDVSTAPLGVEPRVRWGQIVAGLLIVTVGVGWLLDSAGVSVPWRALPAAALVALGVFMVLLRRVHGSLVAFGVVLLLAALVAALPVRGFVGPVGDRSVAPVTTDWPVGRTIGVGTMRVDLTDRALPADGRMDLRVGVGDLRITVPAGAVVRITASVSVGDINVDGVRVSDGVGARWSQTAADPHAVVVQAQVGVGSMEVRHG